MIDIGTQSSLVRLASGRFVLLDAVAFDDETLGTLNALTDDGRALEAIIHLHPFHTLSVRSAHEAFPDARLYGTARHVARAPALPWEAERSEDEALHALFADDFTFFVPEGVDFVSSNEKVHFASVLALHPASNTLHVDDTLNVIRVPVIGGFGFHPTLRQALHPRAGAAAAFRAWAERLAEACASVQTVCAAHAAIERRGEGPGFDVRIRRALADVDKHLTRHKKRWG